MEPTFAHLRLARRQLRKAGAKLDRFAATPAATYRECLALVEDCAVAVVTLQRKLDTIEQLDVQPRQTL